MSGPLYHRVLVKVSGEALMGSGSSIEPKAFAQIAKDLAETRSMGVEIAVVVGGGNFLRGASRARGAFSRLTADRMGMLATVINALALRDAVEQAGASARVMSAIPMPGVCDPYARETALDYLQHGDVVILGGGTGNPFFTTDSGAALRAAELMCEAVLKATDVDGVYDSDPKQNPKAKRYERLTHAEALAKDLKVMDTAAFALARDAALPIIVFSIRKAGAIAATVRGQGQATVVSP